LTMAGAVQDGPGRLLVRGVNWLGDAVMTTPALLRLRARFPAAQITLLTHEKLAELWQGHPALNQVISFQAREGVWSIGRRLREGRFATGILFPNSPRSALELWLAGIPERVGFRRAWRNFFLTHGVDARSGRVEMRKKSVREIQRLVYGSAAGPVGTSVPIGSESHQTQDYLHLVSTLGADPAVQAPRLQVSPQEVTSAAEKFGLPSSLPDGVQVPVLGLNPGAEYGPAKRWPAERFIEAAVEIQRIRSCVWLVFGGPGDLELASRIAAGIEQATRASGSCAAPVQVLNVAGKTSLRELMSLLSVCRVLLTNDTGPMHVAAALGTPVVVVYGSTSPELTGPGLPGDARHVCLRVPTPCAPCFLRVCPIDFRCMQGIQVAEVVKVVSERMRYSAR
jgi:heptosyltransferase II